MKPIRVGLVGFGKIAHDQHLPAIERDSRFKLRAIADPARCGLGSGGADLSHDGVPVALPANHEYAGLYDAFATLIERGASDVDSSPLAIVADAWLVGSRHITPAPIP